MIAMDDSRVYIDSYEKTWVSKTVACNILSRIVDDTAQIEDIIAKFPSHKIITIWDKDYKETSNRFSIRRNSNSSRSIYFKTRKGR